MSLFLSFSRRRECVWCAALLTCKAAGIDLCFPRQQHRGRVLGDQASEHAHSLGGKLAAGLEAGLLGGDRRLRLKRCLFPKPPTVHAHTHLMLNLATEFGAIRYSKVAFQPGLWLFCTWQKGEGGVAFGTAIYVFWGFGLDFFLSFFTVEYTPPVSHFQRASYKRSPQASCNVYTGKNKEHTVAEKTPRRWRHTRTH